MSDMSDTPVIMAVGEAHGWPVFGGPEVVFLVDGEVSVKKGAFSWLEGKLPYKPKGASETAPGNAQPHYTQQVRAPKGTPEGGRWVKAQAAAKAAGVQLPTGYDPDKHGDFNPLKAAAGKQRQALQGFGVPVGGFPKYKAPVKPPEPETTEDRYYNPATEQWAVERRVLHQGLIDKAIQDSQERQLQPLYDTYDRSQPAAVFLVGGPASGKGHVKAHQLLPHHRFVDIDCDSFKEGLPEYQPDTPFTVHRESVSIAKRALKQCLGENRSFVYDSTGLDVHTIERAAETARDQGYQVAVHYVKVPVDVAVARAAKRERKVPEHVVRAKHSEVEWAFGKLREIADHVVVHDNMTAAEKEQHYGS